MRAPTVIAHPWGRHGEDRPDEAALAALVGVAPAGFSGIQPGRPADLFVPMMMKAQMTPFWNGLDDPKDRWLQMVGRLKPGLSPARAETALQVTYRPLLEAELPLVTGWNENRRRQFLNKKMLLVAGGHGRAVLREGYGKPLVSLMGMVLVVLLIACSNVANLILARSVRREGELAVRAAPADPKLRVFLFQLLCVLGEWERGRDQLKALAPPVSRAALYDAMNATLAGLLVRLLAARFPGVYGFG